MNLALTDHFNAVSIRARRGFTLIEPARRCGRDRAADRHPPARWARHESRRSRSVREQPEEHPVDHAGVRGGLRRSFPIVTLGPGGVVGQTSRVLPPETLFTRQSDYGGFAGFSTSIRPIARTLTGSTRAWTRDFPGYPVYRSGQWRPVSFTSPSASHCAPIPERRSRRLRRAAEPGGRQRRRYRGRRR